MSNAYDDRKKLVDELKRLRSRVKELEEEILQSGCAEKDETGHYARDGSNFFRSLISAIPDLVWIKNSEGVYLACNEAFERFFGAKEDKIVGRTDYDFVDKELAGFFRSRDKRAMAAGKPCVNEEWLTIAETGERILVETVKTPVENDEGELVGILGIARDITDRKRIAEGLEKRVLALTRPFESSEDIQFEDLFDINNIQRLQNEFSDVTKVASIITYPDGSPITEPSNFCRLCRDIIRKTEKGLANCYKSDAMLGHPGSDGPTIHLCMSGGLWDAGAAIVVGGHHVANWLIGQVRDENSNEDKMRAYAREIGADEEETVKAFAEVRVMSRDKFRHISNLLFSLTTQLSDIAYNNIQQARFINDLKKTQDELARTRNYLSNIINSMPSLLIGVDAECRVTQWNMEAERVTGLTLQEAEGQPLSKALPRMSAEIHHVKEAIRSRTPMSESLQTNISHGGVIHENVTVYPLIANGVEGAVVRIDDVTDRIRMEQMMVQSEKMLSVGGLAAGMAHEINNPLAGILGYALNIKKRIFGDIKKNEIVAAECGVSLEGVREYLRRREIPRMIDGIHESGTRAAKIVFNMLSFSRKSEAKFMYYDVVKLLDSALDLAASDYDLKKHYDFKMIEIVREYDENIPPIFCESSELQQVFLNLLKNGAEAMMEKVYDSDHPRFLCRVKRGTDRIVVQIEDNGPGIDGMIRKRVFEPFYTTKGVGKGTGLGLSVSYFIITDHHKGELEVDSVLGEWTRFTIKIPFDKRKSGSRRQAR